ncbi:class I SAM-dependent methyltransferase [Slackia piriformis]|uniref:class I SAM-dependent methyltransferase n=1 Tax=Slackia piriformis TaxID=626934 RepID=UPI0032C04C40
MDTKTAEILCKTTADFYYAQAVSFSATRTAPWHGWVRCVDAMTKALGVTGRGVLPSACAQFSEDEDVSHESSGFLKGTIDYLVDEGISSANSPVFSVFDLACGNLRFERYLEEALPDASLHIYAVDSCDELVSSADGPNAPVTYESADIVGGLIDGSPLSRLHHAPQSDMAVSFGFLHHVPGEELRVRVLEGLIDAVRPGGCVAVSLWQFMNNLALAAKAEVTHAQAIEALDITPDALDEGDYLLGWKNVEGAWRYCHHFSDEEVDRLVAAISSRARVIDSFEADGRTGAMNRYVVLQKDVCA